MPNSLCKGEAHIRGHTTGQTFRMAGTRFLLLAAGDETRWDNYMGVHKHLVEVNGERLLDRTIRLIHERMDAEILTLAKHPEYENDMAMLVCPSDLKNGGAVASIEFWATENRTTVLFGDIYFTEDAMDKICAIDEPSRCQFIGRSKASKHHGCPYEEQFGFSLLPEHQEEVSAAIEHVKQALQSGVIKGCTGWATYRHLHGLPLRKHKIRGDFVEIDDFTDDFDFPIDYERWKTHFYGGPPVEAKHGFFKGLFES